MANNTSRLGQRPFKSLLRECNEWLKPDELRVVDWAMGDPEIPPNKRFYLETIDGNDWDVIPCLRTLHEEMCQKHKSAPQNVGEKIPRVTYQ